MPERFRTEIEHSTQTGTLRNGVAQIKLFSPQPGGGHSRPGWEAPSWARLAPGETCVSRAEYDEHGSAVIDMKCP